MTTASLHPVQGEPLAVLEALRAWVDDGGDPLAMRTSGSTGEPKDVLLSRDAMVASATAALDRLGGPGGWLLTIPVTGVGGLQVLVRSILAGVDPVVSGDISAAEVGGSRHYVSIVPTQLHRLDVAGRLGALAEFDAVLLGGAAADPGLLARAAEADVNVVRTYGMTETCGGCVYDGLPLAGVSMRIASDDMVELSGPVLFDGYGDPSATAAVLSGGWFRTGDLGEIGADGRLRITGRADDIVQSGGVKVPLPAVATAVSRVAGVAEAVVLGRPDREWGTEVVAFVVPETGASPRLDQVRDGVEAQGIARTWAPRDLVLVDEFPLLPNGKIDRQRLLGRGSTIGRQE